MAGKKQGRQFVEGKLIPELKLQGVDFEVCYTERYQHAKQLAKGRKNIICVGGDGTTNEILESCPPGATLAVISQGTMNLFGVSADLPSDAKEVVAFIKSGSTRPCSLMRVRTGVDGPEAVSYEAAHIGPMAHRVCQGAQDWRFSIGGSIVGIMINLILGNADPKYNKQRGTMQIWPQNGGPTINVTDDFFWIIMTYRNPYNGVVGNELWVSWMTLETFPGFGRMMKFFEPQMEHFQGTSRCFGCHAKASRVTFTLSDMEEGPVALVLDGDPRDAGRGVCVNHSYGAFMVVGPDRPPKAVNTMRIAVGGGKLTPKPLTKNARAWLKMYPPPPGVEFPEPIDDGVEEEERPSSNTGKIIAVVLFAILVVYVRRTKPV